MSSPTIARAPSRDDHSSAEALASTLSPPKDVNSTSPETFPLQDSSLADSSDDDPSPLLVADDVLEMLLDGDLDPAEDDDDATVQNSNNPTLSMRLNLMVPGDAEAKVPALAFVNACNESLGVLTSKLGQVLLVPWTCTEILPSTKRWTTIPTNLQEAEKILQNFTRFSSGTKGYFRVQIVYPSSIAASDILEACRGINVPGQRFVQEATSSALKPMNLGMLTMTVESMEKNETFTQLLCHIFDVSTLGTRWATQNVPGKSSLPNQVSWRARRVLLVEVDRDDAENKNLAAAFSDFFNVSVTPGNGPLLGMSVNFTPLPPGWQSSMKIKSRVNRNITAHVSFTLGTQEAAVCGTRLLNVLPSGQSLLRAMLQITSIHSMRNKDGKLLPGRVFVGFVPTDDPEVWSAVYPSIFEGEAESILAALPQFIEQQWGVKASSFCRSAFIAQTLADGVYNHETRVFTTNEEIQETARLQSAGIELILPASFNAAPTEKFISAEHQRAFAADANDADTVDTDLRGKRPVPLPPAANDEVSAMTGSTKSSKAKAYADTAVKEVSKQYMAELEKINSENRRLMALLDSRNVTPESAKEATASHNRSDDTSDIIYPSADEDSRSKQAVQALSNKDTGSQMDTVLGSRRSYNAPAMGKMDRHAFDNSESDSTSVGNDRKVGKEAQTDSSEEDNQDTTTGEDEDDEDDDASSLSSNEPMQDAKTGKNDVDNDGNLSDLSNGDPIVLSSDEESWTSRLSGKEESELSDEDDELTTPPRRKGPLASKKFSPRKDANPRPYSFRHCTTKVTGSEGLGAGDSD